jgi:PAS domain-containing protein
MEHVSAVVDGKDSGSRPGAEPGRVGLKSVTDQTQGLQAAFELLPVPALVADRAGRVVACNRALQAVLGADVTPGQPARFACSALGWQRIWTSSEGPVEQPATVNIGGTQGRRHYEVRVGRSGALTIVSLVDVTERAELRSRLAAQSSALATAHAQLRAAREEMIRADQQCAELVAELRAATVQSGPDAS